MSKLSKVHDLLRLAQNEAASNNEAQVAAILAFQISQRNGFTNELERARKLLKAIDCPCPDEVPPTGITVFDSNPYLTYWQNSGGKLQDSRGWSRLGGYEARRAGVHRYAWAVPSEEALQFLVKMSPLVEIGAGSGYWAKMIADRGGDILAYDIFEEGWDFEQQWFDVREGGAEKAKEHSDRTLFLCWPPYDHPMAAEVLQAYEGQLVVFVGEGNGGCCGGAGMWELLEGGSYCCVPRCWCDDDEECDCDDEVKNYKPLTQVYEHDGRFEYIHLPQWDGIHDGLEVFRRIAAPQLPR